MVFESSATSAAAGAAFRPYVAQQEPSDVTARVSAGTCLGGLLVVEASPLSRERSKKKDHHQTKRDDWKSQGRKLFCSSEGTFDCVSAWMVLVGIRLRLKP